MSGLRVTTPIINQLLLIIVGFYNTLPWGLGQSLKKNYNGFATYLSKGRIFPEGLRVFLLLLLSHSLLVLKCEINNCLSLLSYC